MILIFLLIFTVGVFYSAYLVFAHDYDDGVFGRIVLSAMCLSCVGGLMQLSKGLWPIEPLFVVTICYQIMAMRRYYFQFLHVRLMKILKDHSHG